MEGMLSKLLKSLLEKVRVSSILCRDDVYYCPTSQWMGIRTQMSHKSLDYNNLDSRTIGNIQTLNYLGFLMFY